MNNAIYNEYTVDELQASFGYVSTIQTNQIVSREIKSFLKTIIDSNKHELQ